MKENKPSHCVQNVGCQVKDCLYHTDTDKCHAEKITVSNEKAQQKAETFCATFVNRAEF